MNHEWGKREGIRWEVCLVCGIVRRSDGKNSPCNGPTRVRKLESCCQPIRMADGTVVLANLKPGAALNEEEKSAIAEYVQFCRDRKAKKKRKCAACAGTGHTEHGFQDCSPCKGTGLIAAERDAEGAKK